MNPAVQTEQAPSVSEPRDIPTFGALARRFYAEADGDVETASERLAEFLESDRSLLSRMAAVELESLSKAYVHRANCSERAAVMIQAARPAGAIALAAGMARTLMDFPLAGGIKLKDATGRQVAEQAALYRAHADDMSNKARWLFAIAERVPAHVSVGSVLSVDDVTAMFRGE